MKEITDTLILFYYKNHISSVVKMNNPVIFLSTEGNCANNYSVLIGHDKDVSLSALISY
jgi:hypothetical protein